MEDDQQFCLKWNNHQSTLIQNFDTLLVSGTLVDCTLAAEGKYLKAHKVVLSACSPYFEGLLSEHYDKHPVFILKDVKFKELKAMMDYMYRGEVNVSQDQLTALLKAAESLQIKGLSDSRTGGTGGATTGKAETRTAKTASSTAASSSVDIPHASSGLNTEKNSKVPRQSLQQVSVSDLPEDSASPQLRGLSSREGSQSPTRKRKRLRRRSLGNEDTSNTLENHEASNSSDVNLSASALGVVAPVADDSTHAEPADSIGRSALMQQLTKPAADEMLQIPIEKPEPSEEMLQPKSEYLDDQESVEDLTNLDDDMNDLTEMQEDSRAGPSGHDPSQHPAGIASWHMAGDRSNPSVVAGGPPGGQDEVFLAAHEAAQAQRDSQGTPDAAMATNAQQAQQQQQQPQQLRLNMQLQQQLRLQQQQTVTASQAPTQIEPSLSAQMPHAQQGNSLSGPANQPVLYPNYRIMWEGVIDWMKKNKNTNDTQNQTRQIPFRVFRDPKDGYSEEEAKSWPEKLIMQTMPKFLLVNINMKAYLKNSKTVLFYASECDALESLIKVISTGFVGLLHFTSTPTCNIKLLVLLHTAEKRTFVGFIPNDQQAFINCLRELIK